MSSTLWYVRLGDQVIGPISTADLHDRAIQGSVRRRRRCPLTGQLDGGGAVTGISFHAQSSADGSTFVASGLHLPAPVPIVPVSPPSKWQIAGWFILTRAGRVTPVRSDGGWAVICATASLIWRAIQYGAALGRLAGVKRVRRSQLDLGSRCYRRQTSGPGRAKSIRGSGDQIGKERAAKRRPARLLGNVATCSSALAATQP